MSATTATTNPQHADHDTKNAHALRRARSGCAWCLSADGPLLIPHLLLYSRPSSNLHARCHDPQGGAQVGRTTLAAQTPTAQSRDVVARVMVTGA